MEEEYEGGSTSLSTLMNNNPPPMETHRHMPENTVGQNGPISMRDVYDKKEVLVITTFPHHLVKCRIYLLHNNICKRTLKYDNPLKQENHLPSSTNLI